jgi:hypothetical protein
MMGTSIASHREHAMTSVMEPTKDRQTSAQPRPVRRGWSEPSLLTERIPLRIAAVLGGAWLVLGGLSMALEPAPANPDAFPWYANVLAYLFLWTAGATLAGLAGRRRFGIGASIGAATVMTASSVACPLSGHHAFGPWWIGQITASLVLVGLSVVLWVSTRRRAA